MNGQNPAPRPSHPPRPQAPSRPGVRPLRSGGPRPGDLTEQLIHTDFWTDQMVQAAGIPIVDVPFVSVGSGIGSFVTVD